MVPGRCAAAAARTARQSYSRRGGSAATRALAFTAVQRHGREEAGVGRRVIWTTMGARQALPFLTTYHRQRIEQGRRAACTCHAALLVTLHPTEPRPCSSVQILLPPTSKLHPGSEATRPHLWARPPSPCL